MIECTYMYHSECVFYHFYLTDLNMTSQTNEQEENMDDQASLTSTPCRDEKAAIKNTTANTTLLGVTLLDGGVITFLTVFPLFSRSTNVYDSRF